VTQGVLETDRFVVLAESLGELGYRDLAGRVSSPRSHHRIQDALEAAHFGQSLAHTNVQALENRHHVWQRPCTVLV